MSQNDPFERWEARLGKYKYYPKDQKVKTSDGKLWDARTLYQKLEEEAAAATASSSRSRPQPQQPRGSNASASTFDNVFRDQATGLQTRIEAGPAEEVTPEDLQRANLYASTRIRNADSVSHVPSRYRKLPISAFQAGNVIETPFPDDGAGQSGLIAAGDTGVLRPRRLVIVECRAGYSAALPISTYNGKGVAKAGIVKNHHVIIHTSETAPAEKRDEGPTRDRQNNVDALRQQPIRVIPATPGTALDTMSRLNLNEIIVIDHNVEVYVFGHVPPNYLTALLYVLRAVRPEPARNQPQAPQATSVAGESSRTVRAATNPSGQTSGPSNFQTVDELIVVMADRLRALNDKEDQRTTLLGIQRTQPDLYPRLIAYLRRTS